MVCEDEKGDSEVKEYKVSGGVGFIHGSSHLYINRTKGKKIISVKITVDSKLVCETELIFPVDANNGEMASGIVGWESQCRDEMISFEYGDVKKVRG